MHKQRKPMASARSRNGQKEASRRGAPDARERVPTDAGAAIDCARYGYRNRRAPARAPARSGCGMVGSRSRAIRRRTSGDGANA